MNTPFFKYFLLSTFIITSCFSKSFYSKDNLNELKQQCKEHDNTLENQKNIDEWFYSYIKSYETDKDVIKVFIQDCKADVNYIPKSNSSMPPLFEAIYKGDLTLIKLLVQNGTDVNMDTPWRSPLRFALFSHTKDGKKIFSYLLEHGANPNYKDSSGISIVTTIARTSQKYLSNEDALFYAKELLKYDAKVTKKDIIFAKKNSKKELYTILVKYKKVN